MEAAGPHRVLATREARRDLPSVLRDFRRRGAKAPPVVIGAHRKPEGVMISYERYLELLDELDNVAIVAEVDARLERGLGAETELDEAMRELGYDPADLRPE